MANYFDVFNGDADGICALHQLRLEEPREATLVTGVKRDINLLKRVDAAAGDEVTTLDVSLDKNREALLELLEKGVKVTYFDHHFAGEIPEHDGLKATIDTSPETCTSLLVNDALNGARLPWAVVGAFGDNFHEVARQKAEPLGYSEEQLDALLELGTCLNYNGYGVEIEDLFFHPEELYKLVRPYADPFDFINQEPGYQTLRDGYNGDMAKAQALEPKLAEEKVALFILPDEAWARRVSGVFGNDMARQFPERAHAMLTQLEDGAFRISVRAPLATKTGADELCRQFPTGGGRQAAAGVNHLPADQYDHFVEKFREVFA